MPVLKYKDPGSGLWYEVGNPANPTRNISTISSNTTLGSAANTDYIYKCTALLTATLPTAVGNTNKYSIKRTGAGDVTVATTSSQTIDGSTTFVLDILYMSVDVVSDGANWVVV